MVVFLSQNANNSNINSKPSVDLDQESPKNPGLKSIDLGNKLEKTNEPGNSEANMGIERKEEEHKGRFMFKKSPEQSQLVASQQKVKELTETLQRLQAEFENYQKRTAKQNEELIKLANAKLMDELLLVLDSLEQGMQHDKSLALVHEQLYSILRKKGLQKIRAEKGMDFNHDKMECLMQEENNEMACDKVVNVILGGYELNGKVLRPAKVSVNSGAKKEPAPQETSAEEKEPRNVQNA